MGLLSERASGTELLDSADVDDALAWTSYRLMTGVNRWLGGVAVVRRFLDEQLALADGRPLRVLDIGSGACDIPLALGRRRPGVHFTCLEPLPAAARIARAAIARAGVDNVELREESVFDHRPAGPYGCAVASLVLHHFDDVQIRRLVELLGSFVTGSFLVNDLHRTGLALAGSAVLAAPFGMSVWHDTVLSVRRGFRRHELASLLAGPGRAVSTGQLRWAGRVWAAVRFDGGKP